jgi:hypothetical protein
MHFFAAEGALAGLHFMFRIASMTADSTLAAVPEMRCVHTGLPAPVAFALVPVVHTQATTDASHECSFIRGGSKKLHDCEVEELLDFGSRRGDTSVTPLSERWETHTLSIDNSGH